MIQRNKDNLGASGAKRAGPKHTIHGAIGDARLAAEVSNTAFIAHAFVGIGPDESPWVTAFPGDPLTVERKLWGGRGAIPLPWFVRADFNNYVAVSSFNRGSDGKHHRRKANFSRMHMVMIDDVGTKVPTEKLVLSPSVLVETSPRNFQAWYFLNPPESDRKRAENLIDGMIAAGLTADASDPGMKGVTRYGRLPVGVNGKAKYVEKLGAPFIQQVAVWAPATRYQLDDIARAYGVRTSITMATATKGSAMRRSKLVVPPEGDGGILTLLNRAGLYLESASSIDGAHRIICPWLHQHTDAEPSGTIYFQPSDENTWQGGFKCHHGHCQGRTIADLTYFLARLQHLTPKESS